MSLSLFQCSLHHLYLHSFPTRRSSDLDVFNYGKHRRDFTYIDDIVAGIIHTLDHPAQANMGWDSENPDPASSAAPYRIYNIGSKDRKSTRLNSSHVKISYAVFCLKKKK